MSDELYFEFLQDGQGIPEAPRESSAALSVFCKQTEHRAREVGVAALTDLEAALTALMKSLPSGTTLLFLGKNERSVAYGAICSFLLALRECERVLSEQAVKLARCDELIAWEIQRSGDENGEMRRTGSTLHTLYEQYARFCRIGVTDICLRIEHAADMEHEGELLSLYALGVLCGKLQKEIQTLRSETTDQFNH